ncbi:hypothetical protein F5Y10DRAFT_75414 [Nemania abortiva]|nr:hypothetical protein F5Y10DRAFT_75414 [Nemania abortiva]
MPISRKKACEQCRLAKAKCSLESVCSRCLNRGLACGYSREFSRVGPYTRPHPIDSERGLPLAGPSTPAEPLSSLFGPSGLGVPDLGFGNVLHGGPALGGVGPANSGPCRTNGAQGVSWDGSIWDGGTWNGGETATNAPVPGGSLHNEETSGPTVNELPNRMSPWSFLEKTLLPDVERDTSTAASTEQSIGVVAGTESLSQPGRPLSPRGGGEPTTRTEDHILVAIHGERHGRFPALQQGEIEQSLMIRTLMGQIENYPRMLIRGSKLPPFIFPHCVLNNRLSHQCTAVDGAHHCLPPPLANCAALAQMFYGRDPSNSQLVWKLIYDEQKRLYEQSHSYDIPTLLAAVQAMAIYILMQAQDNESLPKNDAASLTAALSEMSTNLHFRSKYHKDIYRNPNLSQKTWVIYESIRRTVNLFYAIRVVLIIQIGSKQPNYCTIRSTPLPCERDLWDSEATETWAIRLNKYKSRILLNRTLTINDLLVALGSSEPGKEEVTDPLVQRDLATWCENLDDHGTLVWMACLLDRGVK